MSRYKGRSKTSLIERDFPHHVELLVPEGGFGKRLDEIYEWHGAHNIIAMHGRNRRDENNRDYVTWCFANADTATAFSIQFAGRLRAE